ncbi:S8 family serine peptidase, partial [Salmonella enterica subsp. enterica serovar Typhimurium]|nr:S8 family serine peptidase [Salmonella enterica subsp. enterica serovar Typhimurium]
NDLEKDGIPNFFGTSAAAPHAAAVGALLIEKAKGNLSPVLMKDYLQRSPLDMDDPLTPDFDTGFDYLTGYGLIQADKAMTF